MHKAVLATCLLGLGAGLTGCEPESITAARDQLSKGPQRTFSAQVPVAVDTFVIGDLLTDWLGIPLITILDNLLAVEANTQTIVVSVGDTVGSVTGVLDPSILNFTLEESVEFSAAGLNLGEFEDAAADAAVNSALLALDVTNTADAPLAVYNFQLGVVMVDPVTGQINRVAGVPDYETDGTGTPILVTAVDPGDTVFSIPRSGSRVDTLLAAALVDRLVDSLLAGSRVALVGSGLALVGDNTLGTITGTDELTIEARPIIGLDFTLPPSGVTVDSSTARPGLDLDDPNANDIESRVDSAAAVLDITNGTPFGLDVDIDVVADSVADAFSQPNRISLQSVSVAPATVDANGRVTVPSQSEVTIRLLGVDVRPFLGEWFTAGVRITLLPPAGGRGAIRATDQVIVDVSALFHLRVGGGQ